MANVFVNYRSSSLDEPLTLYDFRIDFPSSDVGNVSMDLGAFKTRVPKSSTVRRRWIPCSGIFSTPREILS